MDMRKSIGIRITFTVNVLLDIFGMLIFIPLIIVTVRNKKLHSTCHLLIGLYALCCFLNKSTTLVPYFLYLTPSIDKLSLFACAIICLLPACATYSTYSMMFTIAVDRLLRILFPIWYTTREDRFLRLVYSVTALYPLYIATVVIRNMIGQPYFQSQCTLIEVADYNKFGISYCNLFFNFATILCYLLMIAKLYLIPYIQNENVHQQQSNSSHQLSISRTIFKTLSLILVIQIFGWTVTTLGYAQIGPMLTNLLGGMNETVIIYYQCLGCFSSIIVTAEVPAIYFSSSEHRAAIRKEFPWFFRIFCRQNAVSQVVTINGVNVNNQIKQMNRIIFTNHNTK